MIYQNRNLNMRYDFISRSQVLFKRNIVKIHKQTKDDTDFFLENFLKELINRNKLIGCDKYNHKKNKYYFLNKNRYQKWQPKVCLIFLEKFLNLIDELNYILNIRIFN